MSVIVTLTVPLVIVCTALCATFRGVDTFGALSRGVMEGLKTVRDMLPPLIVLFPAVYMLRDSGALNALAEILTPFLSAVGVPPETVPLAVLRPVSGGAATALAADIIKNSGADSLAGRTAAVMMGSSETTFYVIAVYFGSAKIKKTRWAIPAALAADLAVFLSSAWICRVMWG